MDDTRPPALPRKRILLAVVLAPIGLWLLAGGAYLITLGGSPYYAAAGMLVCAAAVLAVTRPALVPWVYSALLVGTAVWAIAENPANGWALQARLLAPAVLGIWVLWPWLALRPRMALGGAALVAAGATGWCLLPPGAATPLTVGAPAALVGNLASNGEWPVYGNDQGGSRFSGLTQINAGNVAQLQPAWTFHTGASAGIGFETTPLMVNNTLYFCSETNIVFAADPETGAKRWTFDPKADVPGNATCRGVSYYKVPGASGPCAARIILATVDARLIAVDADSGQLCAGFGRGGTVDLKQGMGDVRRAYYYVSSAPLIARGKIVLGGWVMDGQYVGEPSGVIRAFDAVSGEFRWAWDMDRPDFHGMPPAGQTFSRGTANSWGPMSFDDKLGLVFAPTGNSTPDYWGAHRSAGSEKYSASVVALDIETGARRWSFQTSHHDVWDYDVSAQPTLIDLPVNGQTVPALLQATKRGQVFMLDRRDGRPIAAVEEKPVPQRPAPGDWLSPTQPFSTGMPAFDNERLSESGLWGATPLDQLWCRIRFREARYEGPMTPPGIKPSITYPSYIGGINWGGVSVDPQRRVMMVNWTRLANYTRLVRRQEADRLGVVPSKDGGVHVGQPVPQMGTPFALLTGPFLSPLGLPCTSPPFGKIAAVSLDSRKIIWERPLGTSRDSGPFGVHSLVPLPMGVPNTGGTLTTASGLVFVGATQERTFRALDTATGRTLWSTRIPAGGNASPMTYVSPRSGRQFVVIAAGGNASFGSGRSDALVAFALPATAH